MLQGLKKDPIGVAAAENAAHHDQGGQYDYPTIVKPLSAKNIQNMLSRPVLFLEAHQ